VYIGEGRECHVCGIEPSPTSDHVIGDGGCTVEDTCSGGYSMGEYVGEAGDLPDVFLIHAELTLSCELSGEGGDLERCGNRSWVKTAVKRYLLPLDGYNLAVASSAVDAIFWDYMGGEVGSRRRGQGSQEGCPASGVFEVYITSLRESLNRALDGAIGALVEDATPLVTLLRGREGDDDFEWGQVCAAETVVVRRRTIPALDRFPSYRPSSMTVTPAVTLAREGDIAPPQALVAGDVCTVIVRNFLAGSAVAVQLMNSTGDGAMTPMVVRRFPQGEEADLPWVVPEELEPGAYYFRAHPTAHPAWAVLSSRLEIVPVAEG
jgi:hypothetical protein